MQKSKLEQMDFAGLTSNFRALKDALDKLAEVERDLIEDSTLNQLRDVYQQIEDEFRRRGYSREEIADI